MGQPVVSDYHLQLKVKNGYLIALMQEWGITTASELSRQTGVDQVKLGHILNLKTTAYRKDGHTVLKAVQILCDFFGVSVEAIFPEQHLRCAVAQNTFSADVNLYEMQQITGLAATNPEQVLEYFQTENRDAFEDMVKSLPPREQNVLRLRIKDDLTLEQTGECINVSKERVRQLEMRAYRRLRNPKCKSNLEDAAGIYAS